MAALLISGDGGVLSHRSAAILWGLLREPSTPVDVSVPRSMRSSKMIRRHRIRLAPDEVTARRGMPVTTITRTLFDLAAELSQARLEAAIREAEYLHRFQVESLKDQLGRYAGRRGATSIKVCLHRLGLGPRGRTRNRLEARFAGLLARTDLPKPALNALLDLDGFTVEADCLWRDQRLIIELDGGQAHRTRAAFETDRERDRHLQVAGWKVIRVTWRQLDEPKPLLTDLRRLLLDENAFTRDIGGKVQRHPSCRT